MFASSSLDASICLRCHLRLALRQITSPAARLRSTPRCIPQHRYQSTEAATGEDRNEEKRQNGFTFKDLRPLVRGRNGRQHREASEKLSIDSLGKSSEVIVLRDVPKRKKKKIQSEAEVSASPLETPAGPKAPASLTAKEIESYADKRIRKAPQDEINASIEKVRPGEDENVVTKKEFETKAKELFDAFNIAQLRGYIRSYSKRTTALPSSAESQSNTKSDTGIRVVTCTPWHTGTSKLEIRLPVVENARQLLRRMPPKQLVIEQILRDCWGLRVEEEEDATGELEILLRPDQFGLLLTKNSPALAPLLQSTKYYRNSRFELYKADSVIRIIGPRSEAQSIATTLQDAFKGARSTTIPLDKFPKPWLRDINLSTLFTSEQLQGIMDVTKTHIGYDAENERIICASFADRNALEDAYRLLLSLLPLPFRNKTTHLGSDIPTNKHHLVPFLDKKALPSRFNNKKLGRPVAPIATQEEQTSLISDGTVSALPGVAQRALRMMDIFRPVRGTSGHGMTHWSSRSVFSPWSVTFGYHLETLENSHSKSTAVRDGLTTIDNTRPNETFLPRLPGLFSILSDAERTPSALSAIHTDRPQSFSSQGRPYDRLEAILVPSPLEAFGLLANTAFPILKFKFILPKRYLRLPVDRSGMDTEDVESTVSFKGIEAQLHQDICEIMLPDKPVDLRLHRQESLITLDEVKDDPSVKAFVDAVKSSIANDFNLRAPPSLTMTIPSWVIKTTTPAEGRKQKESFDARKLLRTKGRADMKVKYLFQGFRHRTSRLFDSPSGKVGDHYFSPDHSLLVDHVEGGVTGGRRIEVSVIRKRVTSHSSTAGYDATVTAGVPMPAVLRPHATPLIVSASYAETSQLQDLLRTSFSMVDMVFDMERKNTLQPNVFPEKQTSYEQARVLQSRKASFKPQDKGTKRHHITE